MPKSIEVQIRQIKIYRSANGDSWVARGMVHPQRTATGASQAEALGRLILNDSDHYRIETEEVDNHPVVVRKVSGYGADRYFTGRAYPLTWGAESDAQVFEDINEAYEVLERERKRTEPLEIAAADNGYSA